MNIYIESASGNKIRATKKACEAILPESNVIPSVSVHQIGDLPTIKTSLTKESCLEGSKNRARRMNVDPILASGSIALGIHKTFIAYSKEKRVTFGLAVSGFITKEGTVEIVTRFEEIPVEFPDLVKHFKTLIPSEAFELATGIDISDKRKPLYTILTGKPEVPWIERLVREVLSELIDTDRT